MKVFNWTEAAQTFADFGGQPQVLHIPKTGLPFFDTLRLYGAIELYVGLQQEIYIHDAGNEWEVKARVREHRLKDVRIVAATLKKGRPRQHEHWITQLVEGLKGGLWSSEIMMKFQPPLITPDSALQSGIRNQAAANYRGLEARSTDPDANIEISWADALLSYAGQRRIDTKSKLYFLPVFEGKVDFAKVISPLRARVDIPNILCAQAMILLALKTSLFAEGYSDKLSAVVYNRIRPKSSDNYSGVIEIESTALGKSRKANSNFVRHFHHTFQRMVRGAWLPQGKGKPSEVEDAITHAYWLMQPKHPKNLSALVTSVERQRRNGKITIIAEPGKSYVKEVFRMSYGKWEGDHETVRKFAKAVASGIWYARQKKLENVGERGRAWYDEVVMLRSAPTARAFFERAMILLEQGKKEELFLGSARRSEDFDPSPLFKSIGNNRSDFETFRDLFRMYLVQESTPKSRSNVNVGSAESETPLTDEAIDEKGDEQ